MSSSTPHRRRASGGRVPAALLAAVLALGTTLLFAGPAAAASTVKAQLSLTGVVSSDNPTGGATLGIHPGDSVNISPSLTPTRGLDKLGLGDLVTGLTGALASYQVEADFSGLPGGSKATTLDSNGSVKSKTFTFPKTGTYHFTWSAQSVGLLGAVPINLDGNQLKSAGVELNAKNQYVGTIVVATNPPKGGISIQVPGTSVQPKVGPVQLPKVSLPGVTTPTITTSLPDLNLPVGGSGSGGSGGSGGDGSTGSNSGSGQAQVIPVPALVMPQGSGQVIGSTSGYAAGSTGFGSSFSGDVSSFGTPATSGATSSAVSRSVASSQPAAKTSRVDAAGSRPAATSGMPIVLAIVAVIALVLVAGTYARLFLLGKGKGDTTA